MTGSPPLTTQRVVEIRRQLRGDPTLSINWYVVTFKYPYSSLWKAVRGLSHKEADVIELPITKHEAACVKKTRRLQINDVVMMREVTRKTQKAHVGVYTKRYNMSELYILKAIRGLTYKHVNKTEPPVTIRFTLVR